MKKLRTELLAPAGNFECLKAAVESGADAVYIGGERFSARGNAKNFDRNELKTAAEFCRENGKKIYLAMNTAVLDKEVRTFLEDAEYAQKIGVNALILQDLGMARLLKKKLNIPHLHMSTQGTVHTADGMKMAKKLGFERVVLARELSLEQVSKLARIAGTENIETEVFIHGARCVCVSGQCYMSAVIGSRSANRGYCASPCRLPYKSAKTSGFLLSPGDINYGSDVLELLKIGVNSLKIEGRMRSAEYVISAVKNYRKILSIYENGEK